ncbi:pyruvate dehydrogenase (acetyl-transferring) E1 component subunit alpha [Azoarcus sp. KH32C]|uniref:pyruvate dehydrogenase (acetyl-transferring) E1 component subunit alpha n=1 Tax=Azoarcus sp. KH32C TaxID=748247 RepID=UPI0002385F0D|nr:pyruvate dehydrogenase (acetyl-transferring) E1 component subunit alpha [Azoarcus sp. KH32C]BAL25589.1 pyruvate dehydrogenase E1 component (alpha subunit) oxidoreductase protein [Azoarcus sp. KH32C]
MTTVGQFQVEYTRFLDPQGEATQALPDFALDPANLIPLYRAMQLTRVFDTKAIAMQRTGKIGTFASALGQEAIGVGTASAMRPEDVLVPSYRDHAAQFVRGVTMTESLLYWGGDETGSNFAVPRLDFPICVPIATQVCHAAGVAYAFKLRKEARVAACFLGDGATSKGDFYEGLNLAAVWKAPLVVVVNNNQWAISVPRTLQTVTPTLAQKAIAAGVEGWQVDGNDIIAMYDAARRAIDKARSGGGPTLIEALSYRLGDHTTADDASRYRDAATVEEQWTNEPIRRLRNYLVRIKAWGPQQEEQLLKECGDAVAKAVDDYLAAPPPTTDDMFRNLYATLPAAMQSQLDDALHAAAEGGDHV